MNEAEYLTAEADNTLYGWVRFRHAIGQFAVRNLLYGPKFFKENAHFGGLNLFTSEKMFK